MLVIVEADRVGVDGAPQFGRGPVERDQARRVPRLPSRGLTAPLSVVC